MSVYTIQDTTLSAIADAIREKDGSSEPILVSDFADKIEAIPTGGGGDKKFEYCNLAYEPSVTDDCRIGYTSDELTFSRFRTGTKIWKPNFTHNNDSTVYRYRIGFSCTQYNNSTYHDQTLIASETGLSSSGDASAKCMPRIGINQDGTISAYMSSNRSVAANRFDLILTTETVINVNERYVVDFKLSIATDNMYMSLKLYNHNGELLESLYKDDFEITNFLYTKMKLGCWGSTATTYVQPYYAYYTTIWLEDTFIEEGGVIVWGIKK